MALLSLIFVLVQSLIQYPQPARDGLDEAVHQRMQERQELLDHEMARLLQELEQRDKGWGALLFGALQQWPFLALCGLLLLLGFWFHCRRSCKANKGNSSSKDQRSCKTLGEEKRIVKEEDDRFDSKKDEENINETVEADDSSSGNEGEGSPVSANEGDNDDANEQNDDAKLKKDSDVKSDNGCDAKKDEGQSDRNMPGNNYAEGNEEEPGNVTGGMEDLDEEKEGENKDVKVEQDKDAGKGKEGDGNEEKTNDAYMRAGNDDDVCEGENGKEEKSDVKAQESSDASEQRSSDWTGQEGSSDGRNAVGHGFGGSEEDKNDVGNEEGSDGNKDEKPSTANMKEKKNEDGNEEEHGNLPSTDEGGDKSSEGERNNVKVDRHSSEHKTSDWNGKDEEHRDVNVNREKNKDGKEEEQGGNVAASEKEGSGAGKDHGGIKEEEDAHDVGNKRGILLVDHIQWPVEDLERGCSVAAELMESFTRVFVDSVSNSFYPVPQEAIGVGSAFEGWSPRDQDVVYRVLVPLNPPPGHAFQLELNSAGQMAARTFCVRVELVCMCKREQLGEKLLCFLHHSQEELRRKQKPSLLETLCTGSCLDVEKTSHWFYQLVRCSWLHLPQSYSWHLVFQPCSRSCQFRLSQGKKSVMVEMLFGVRHGDSDIFVVSQPTESQKGSSIISVSSRPAEADFIPSTAWPETYAVAEAKFFRYVSRQMLCESLHLKCLQVFTCILRGTGFSSSTWKTVVMHVLTTVPLSRWRRREFARRLWDIMAYLRRCLQLKRLEHFVLGNERLPAEISLPPAMRTVEPLNLFEHLARDPAAHREAMRAYGQLRFRLWMLLSSH